MPGLNSHFAADPYFLKTAVLRMGLKTAHAKIAAFHASNAPFRKLLYYANTVGLYRLEGNAPFSPPPAK